jgi:hypothetical protein
VSYEFSLVLSRKISDDEAETLIEAGPGGAALTAAPLPTDAAVTVTRLDFDTEAPNLAEAIKQALGSLEKVPGLTAASLEVPAQPSGGSGEVEGARDEPGAVAEVVSDSHHDPASNGASASADAERPESAAPADTGAAAPAADRGPVRKTSRSRKKSADAARGEVSNLGDAQSVRGSSAPEPPIASF